MSNEYISECILNDTARMMLSDNYIDRFKAEYTQLLYRCNKLEDMLKKYANSELDFEPKCSYTLLDEQLTYMKMYLNILKIRSAIEGIEV